MSGQFLSHRPRVPASHRRLPSLRSSFAISPGLLTANCQLLPRPSPLILHPSPASLFQLSRPMLVAFFVASRPIDISRGVSTHGTDGFSTRVASATVEKRQLELPDAIPYVNPNPCLPRLHALATRRGIRCLANRVLKPTTTFERTANAVKTQNQTRPGFNQIS